MMLTCECMECGHRWTTEDMTHGKCPACLRQHVQFSGTYGGITFTNCEIDNTDLDAEPKL